MTSDSPSARLTIYLGAADRTGVRPAPEDIIRRAHAAGLTAATLHRLPQDEPADGTRRTISLSHPASVTVTIHDHETKLQSFLRQLDDLRDAGATMLLEGADEYSNLSTLAES
jgi:PII-like signaling protein